MIHQPLPTLDKLYESDETAWLESMAELIRLEQYDQLDYPHLHEFLDDTARRDKREVESRLAILMAHQLKWDYQQAKRTPLLAGYYRTAAAGVAAASGERYAPQSH